MASIAGVRAKIQGLIDKINNNIEEQSTDLTTAVDTVIDGLDIVESAIQQKAGISEKLEFPLGWKAAVDGITGGGGGDGSPAVVEVVMNIGVGVSVTAGEPPKNHALYNGVRLPKIPEDALEQYPFVWIRDNAESGVYDLLMAPTTWYRIYATIDMLSSVGAWYQMPKSSAQTAAEWPYKQSLRGGNMGISATKTVLWANHDIPDGSVTATGIYFKGSEPVPTA